MLESFLSPTHCCALTQPAVNGLGLPAGMDTEGRWGDEEVHFYFQFHFESIPAAPASALLLLLNDLTVSITRIRPPSGCGRPLFSFCLSGPEEPEV